MIAATCARWRRAVEGSRVIAEAKDLVTRNNEHMWVSELDRLEGELRQLQGASVADIEARFQNALAVSRQQRAKSFELRAATSLARLWCDQGKRTEARDLLTPVYSWFTEGFDTPDLQEARSLLDELG
jgi:predicted ATPase